MLCVSEILLKHQEAECFADLIELVKEGARNGERFFEMDVKPEYTDTPDDWENQLESAFNGIV
jgi:hypothetical protein